MWTACYDRLDWRCVVDTIKLGVFCFFVVRFVAKNTRFGLACGAVYVVHSRVLTGFTNTPKRKSSLSVDSMSLSRKSPSWSPWALQKTVFENVLCEYYGASSRGGCVKLLPPAAVLDLRLDGCRVPYVYPVGDMGAIEYTNNVAFGVSGRDG